MGVSVENHRRAGCAATLSIHLPRFRSSGKLIGQRTKCGVTELPTQAKEVFHAADRVVGAPGLNAPLLQQFQVEAREELSIGREDFEHATRFDGRVARIE